MPGFLVHVGATVQCAHLGTATPTAPNPRVLVSGQPTVTMAAPYAVAACPFNVSGSPSPCVTAQWTSAATRVFSNGQPLVLLDSQATCAPNATPLVILATQVRVTGT
ncbi:MAG TPA: hypothetical protein VHQ94_07040 [Pyrinomonadaceae bacterium]|nr:hypothetical protein [Pyrinomonadaceae bacterium]